MSGEISAACEIRRDTDSEFRHIRRINRQDHNNLTVAMRDYVGIVEMAFAFGRAALAEGQQTRQAAIGGAVLGEGEKARAVAQIETAADDEPEPDLLCRVMGAHDTGKAVVVGDRDRRMTECRRGHHQLVRMRCTAQKREIGGDLQLRVDSLSLRGAAEAPRQSRRDCFAALAMTSQEKTPWTNQRGL